ncbi:sensor histidine kinase [Usitatibacter palustris]|uniref:histidine kinase n=1 Tax=Usitatibacter palustris TaxID=2732487 RepID=A0A6M4H979_9PROT|nr:ATP-binding protein [Usitatibacter palustris]QJR14944.1 Adaptive-response sensory-kinase SasA [Usitatibacter palustris]
MRSFWIAVLLAGFLQAPVATAQQDVARDETTWRVVVIHNADYLIPASAIMEQALRETLSREAPHSVEFFGESLDSFRFGRKLEGATLALLRQKYAGRKVDLVIARSRQAIDFAARYRDELWPGVPLVFYNELPEALRENGPPANATGVLIDLDLAATIAIARRLHPNARALHMIAGASPYDQRWKERIEPLLARLGVDYKVTWLDHLTVPQMLEAVALLPPDSLVFYISVVTDAGGKPRASTQVARQIAAASAAPVYGFFETYLGTGVVGGAIPDFATQGTSAARLALRVLKGEPATSIPIEPASPAKCILDERALQRFHVPESAVPSGCEIQFRPRSAWRDYRWPVLVAAVTIVVQTMLIAVLFTQRSRRRRAETAAHQRSVELGHALRLATIGEMTAAISQEIDHPPGDGPRASEVMERIRAILQKHDVAREVFDPNELVTDALHLIEAEAARRGVSLDVQTAPGAPRITGDRIQLQQLLINLVLNAMDAMAQAPTGSRRVVVRLSRLTGQKVQISVSDIGHGIGPEISDRLFTPFFTTRPRGLGLGLSIARTIAQAHGGTIQAEGNSAGGATFRVTLPEAGT